MLNPREYEIQKIRREEIRQKSERLNQIQAAHHQFGDEDSHPLYASMLAGVGQVLIQVGSKLQERYGSLVEEVAAEAGCADSSTLRGTV